MSHRRKLSRWSGLATVVLSIMPLASVFAAVDPINKNLFGTALKGYDAVAYFKDNRAIEGKSAFRHDWRGA